MWNQGKTTLMVPGTVENIFKKEISSVFSRIVPSEEVSVHRRFIAQVEKDFQTQITYDVCGHRGVQIITEDGRVIPYCSRFADGGQAHLNFLSNT